MQKSCQIKTGLLRSPGFAGDATAFEEGRNMHRSGQAVTTVTGLVSVCAPMPYNLHRIPGTVKDKRSYGNSNYVAVGMRRN